MATNDLCSAADVQAFMGISAGQDVALIQSLVANASVFVLNYTNRIFLQQTYAETRNGHGGSSLPLREYPITAVASMSIDGVAVQPATSATGAGYVFDSSLVYLRCGQVFTRGAQNVSISYTAGYATVPLDMVQATIEIVASKYKRRQDLHVSSKILDGQTIAFVVADLTPTAKLALQAYQRVFMA